MLKNSVSRRLPCIIHLWSTVSYGLEKVCDFVPRPMPRTCGISWDAQAYTATRRKQFLPRLSSNTVLGERHGGDSIRKHVLKGVAFIRRTVSGEKKESAVLDSYRSLEEVYTEVSHDEVSIDVSTE